MACRFMRAKEEVARQVYMESITNVRKMPEVLGMQLEAIADAWRANKEGRGVNFSVYYSDYRKCVDVDLYCSLSKDDRPVEITSLLEAIEESNIGKIDVANCYESQDKEHKYYEFTMESEWSICHLQVIGIVHNDSDTCRKVKIGEKVTVEDEYEWQCL